MNAPANIKAAPALSWAHAPSPLAWSVMCFGGKNPRTGEDQRNLEVQFHRAHYSTEGILWRANDFAKGEHRTHFAVRDTDGSVIYDGPVLDEIEAPRVFNAILADDFLNIAKGQRQFARLERGRSPSGPGAREPSPTVSALRASPPIAGEQP